MNTFLQYLENHGNTPELESLVKAFEDKYPGIDLYVWDNGRTIELYQIVVPPEVRGRGINSEVVTAIQAYARTRGLPVVLRPEPEKGKKAALLRFYKRHGFVANAGRHRDYSLSIFFGPSMYWRPK